MDTKKTVVTGGAGFIGSHVVRELLARGQSVVVFDSFVTGSHDAVPEGVTVIEGDIRDPEAVLRSMQHAQSVVHLAALVSVPQSIQDPTLTEAVNIEGTKNVFNAAREAGVSRIVYASSAAVYGNDPSVPKSEESVLVPLSPYATSKRSNEEYARTHEVSSMGLRFFNVYGPGQKGSHPYASVIPRWLEALEANAPITLHGDGSQTRDFVHVSDVAQAVAQALASGARSVVNIATGEERSLRSVIELLGTIRGEPLQVIEAPTREGDIKRSFADISKAKELIGFSPKISFEDGLRDLASRYGLAQ